MYLRTGYADDEQNGEYVTIENKIHIIVQFIAVRYPFRVITTTIATITHEDLYESEKSVRNHGTCSEHESAKSGYTNPGCARFPTQSAYTLNFVHRHVHLVRLKMFKKVE
jgi:hypothetical protein